jgi:hypothetical protein
MIGTRYAPDDPDLAIEAESVWIWPVNDPSGRSPRGPDKLRGWLRHEPAGQGS